jgi:hypothetical protein
VFINTRLVKDADRLLSDDFINPEVAFLLLRDRNTFLKLVHSMQEGSAEFRIPASKGEEKDKLAEISAQFEMDNQAVSAMQNNLKQLVELKGAVRYVVAYGEGFFQSLLDLRNQISATGMC